MTEITIASFNLNNLFSRFNWEGTAEAGKDGVTYLQRDASGAVTELPDVEYIVRKDADDRRRTYKGEMINAKPESETKRVAERIRELDADVLLVQEVEDQQAVEDFNDIHLGGMYRQIVVLEGNDDRFIDVGVMVRAPWRLGGVTTWKHITHPDQPTQAHGIFSRDLLQAALLNADGEPVMALFNTHLKSHYVDRWNDEKKRPKTTAELAKAAADADLRRTQQAEAAMSIVAELDGPVLLAGDMNDPPEAGTLVAFAGGGLVDLLANATESQPPPAPRAPEDVPPTVVWSHRFSKPGAPDQYKLFDHLWASPELAQHLVSAQIQRRRLWTKDGSDHDPVRVVLKLP